MIGKLKKASDFALFIGRWIIFVYMAGVTFLAIIGIFFRFLGQSLSWNEELMRWFLVGLGYIAASVGIRTRNHIGIEFFLDKMGKSLKKICLLISYLAVIVFLFFVMWYGFEAALNARRQYGAIIQLPMIWVKMNLPLGSLFMFIHITYLGAGLIQEKDDFRKYQVSGGTEGEINL